MHVSKFVLANVLTFFFPFQLLGTRFWLASKIFWRTQASGMRGLSLSRPDGEKKDLKQRFQFQ